MNNKKQHAGFYGWLERRIGIDQMMHEALDEPIPGGARLAYVFGSGLLFLFLSQVITGLALALYYVPSTDHAHTTVAYISKVVAAGEFLRSLHAYGSSAIIVVLLLHVLQTVFYGSYKGRRELLWISGCVLATLMFAMAFTGYLLPWDQKAYFATAVGTNIVGEVPGIGGKLELLMRGGPALGTLTISRFFVAHVLLIPGMIFAFVALHVFFFRKAGAAGPISAKPRNSGLPTTPFYPGQVIIDMAFALALIAVLSLLAHFFPFPVGPRANPADSTYLPRPEWYYIPVFQWLKYWEGSRAFLGVVLIPAVIVLLFVLLPFLDRGAERRPWRRPIPVGGVVIVLLGLAGLGWASHSQDTKDPSIASQLHRQDEAVVQYMKQPFKPEESGGGATATGEAKESANPMVQAGEKLYQDNLCSACHGVAGKGGIAAPLSGIGSRMSSQQLQTLLTNPTPKMTGGGMPPVPLKDGQLKQLVAYLMSLK